MESTGSQPQSPPESVEWARPRTITCIEHFQVGISRYHSGRCSVGTHGGMRGCKTTLFASERKPTTLRAHVCGGRHVHVVNTHSHALHYTAVHYTCSVQCVCVCMYMIFRLSKTLSGVGGPKIFIFEDPLHFEISFFQRKTPGSYFKRIVKRFLAETFRTFSNMFTHFPFFFSSFFLPVPYFHFCHTFFWLHFRGDWDRGENCVPHGQRRTLRGMSGRSAWPPAQRHAQTETLYASKGGRHNGQQHRHTKSICLLFRVGLHLQSCVHFLRFLPDFPNSRVGSSRWITVVPEALAKGDASLCDFLASFVPCTKVTASSSVRSTSHDDWIPQDISNTTCLHAPLSLFLRIFGHNHACTPRHDLRW